VRVDPRGGGLRVAFGEWTVVPEAQAIRRGRVTFVVVNRGRYAHGFRVSAADEGGHGTRTRVLRPGEQATLTMTVAAGTYELECFVEDEHGDHEDLGMRALLEVRANAPLVQKQPARRGVSIRGFAYTPGTLRVARGQTVRWVNDDAAPHTVTAANGSFTSKQLAKGSVFTRRFARAGSYAYLCAVHPQMKARVVVR
jgi:plastocyanin